MISSVSAYELLERWTETATTAGGSMGSPVTLTWGFVQEGTPIPGASPSRLIGFMDAGFEVQNGEPGGLETRPWFDYYQRTFDRWSEISGVTFVYEPEDDGVAVGGAPGILGVRADIRIGGSVLDGGGGVLGAAELPNSGDLLIDTSDASYFMNPADEYRRLRHVLAHEQGHGLGLGHVQSDDSAFLMEPFSNFEIEGPQLDEIRGLHRAYGDAFEKFSDGRGNNTSANAVSLGELLSGSGISIGTSVGVGPLGDTVVDNAEVDFVSIDDNSDVDFFSFRVETESLLTAKLTPVGPTYRIGPQNSTPSYLDSSAVSDLTLTIFDTDGFSIMTLENSSGLGDAEMISDLPLPSGGEYFARITGNANDVQMYQLDLGISIVPEPIETVTWIAFVSMLFLCRRMRSL